MVLNFDHDVFADSACHVTSCFDSHKEAHHDEHTSSSFPWGAGGGMFGQPAGGGMYGQPMGGGMYGQPASGGMYGQPAGPYGGMQGGAGMAPAGGMAPGGMFGGTPQSKSWLMNRTTGPAFAPPPPAEAAANWANHAAIANSKAEGALSEILAIKQAAISKMKELDIKADRIQQDFNSMRESTISDLRKEAATVWHNYQEAKQSTMQMLKAAETQAIAAKKLVTGASDAVRVKSASFAQRAVDTSFAKKVPVSAAPKGGAKDTKSDPEVDAVLQSIRNYMAKLKAGEVKVAVKTPLLPVMLLSVPPVTLMSASTKSLTLVSTAESVADLETVKVTSVV